MPTFDLDHVLVRWVAFVGGAMVVIGNSDRPVDDPKLWALAIAGGCAALGVLLRPPGVQKPPQEPDLSSLPPRSEGARR